MGKEALPLNCMKCGREISLGQVFCKDCLADMEQYPIKPGTPVQLPVQPETVTPRRNTTTRKTRKPEEQIALLRKLVLSLGLALLVVVLAFAITVSVLLHRIEQSKDSTLPGQNYSTVENDTTT